MAQRMMEKKGSIDDVSKHFHVGGHPRPTMGILSRSGGAGEPIRLSTISMMQSRVRTARLSPKMENPGAPDSLRFWHRCAVGRSLGLRLIRPVAEYRQLVGYTRVRS